MAESTSTIERMLDKHSTPVNTQADFMRRANERAKTPAPAPAPPPPASLRDRLTSQSKTDAAAGQAEYRRLLKKTLTESLTDDEIAEMRAAMVRGGISNDTFRSHCEVIERWRQAKKFAPEAEAAKAEAKLATAALAEFERTELAEFQQKYNAIQTRVSNSRATIAVYRNADSNLASLQAQVNELVID